MVPVYVSGCVEVGASRINVPYIVTEPSPPFVECANVWGPPLRPAPVLVPGATPLPATVSVNVTSRLAGTADTTVPPVRPRFSPLIALPACPPARSVAVTDTVQFGSPASEECTVICGSAAAGNRADETSRVAV